MTDTNRYNNVAIILHWIIALLMIFMLFPGGEFMEVRPGEVLASDTIWQPTAHASIGILILLLTLVRIVWRLTYSAPPPLADTPAWQNTISHIVHGLLYVLMLAIPLSGWFAFAPYGAERLSADDVTFFRLFSVNVMPNLGDWTGEAHEILGTLAKILVGIHVAAALKHQFWDKDGLIGRMWFTKRKVAP